MKRVILGFVAVLVIILYFFRGHIYLGVNGCLIVLTTPTNVTNTYSKDAFYHYEMLVNGAVVEISLGRLYEPLQLTSKKLGKLELNILADIRDERRTIQASGDLSKVQESDYSIRQVNLLYEYFGKYFSENRVLTVPDYTDRPGNELRLLMEVVLLFGIYLIDKKREKDEKTIDRQKVLFVIGILAVLYLAIKPVLTLL